MSNLTKPVDPMHGPKGTDAKKSNAAVLIFAVILICTVIALSVLGYNYLSHPSITALARREMEIQQTKKLLLAEVEFFKMDPGFEKLKEFGVYERMVEIAENYPNVAEEDVPDILRATKKKESSLLTTIYHWMFKNSPKVQYVEGIDPVDTARWPQNGPFNDHMGWVPPDIPDPFPHNRTYVETSWMDRYYRLYNYPTFRVGDGTDQYHMNTTDSAQSWAHWEGRGTTSIAPSEPTEDVYYARYSGMIWSMKMMSYMYIDATHTGSETGMFQFDWHQHRFNEYWNICRHMDRSLVIGRRYIQSNRPMHEISVSFRQEEFFDKGGSFNDYHWPDVDADPYFAAVQGREYPHKKCLPTHIVKSPRTLRPQHCRRDGPFKLSTSTHTRLMLGMPIDTFTRLWNTYIYEHERVYQWRFELKHGRKLIFEFSDPNTEVYEKISSWHNSFVPVAYIDGNGQNNRLNFSGAHTCHPMDGNMEDFVLGQAVYMTGQVNNLIDEGLWEALPVVSAEGAPSAFYGIYLEMITGENVVFQQGNYASAVPRTDERMWIGAHGNMKALAYADVYEAGDYLVSDGGKYLVKSEVPGVPLIRCLQDIELLEAGKLAIEM